VFFNHTGFAALKLKDSIADFFRKEYGARPAVDTKNPGIIINLHITNRHVTISFDSSGDPLFKRGYRRGTLEAPLNEVLAAGMIRLSGWEGKSDIIDPMCGSGTIPIEAAMMASNIPPGQTRPSFGFQNWRGYDEKLFSRIRENFDSRIRKPGQVVYGHDISEKAVLQTNDNVRNAGVEDYVNISLCDFSKLKPPGHEGYILMNPPYGERLRKVETDALYSMIGSVLKHSFTGYIACLISSNKESVKQVGLKPVRKLTLYNGSLECVYLVFELYEGSRKSTRSK